MLYLSAVFLAFFLAFLLITKKEKSIADYILMAWLGFTGIHLLTYYLYSTGQFTRYPDLIVAGFPLPLLQGPFLYLYTLHQTSRRRFKPVQLLHFLPFILSYVLFSEFFFLDPEKKIEIFRLKGQGYETHAAINIYAIYLSGIIYVTISLIRLFRYRKTIVNEFSNTEKINFNWLLYLIIWMLCIWIVIMLSGKDEFVFGSAALFILWLGYFGIKQVQVFSRKNVRTENITLSDASADTVNAEESYPEDPVDTANQKYQRSSLSENEAERIHDRLNQLLSEEKPFRDPELTLHELAKQLAVHPNHLSQVINSKENKNFYDLINQRRVEEFIKMVSGPGNKQYTLLGMALDCGFNSKASFNRNFKKYKQVTPSDYLKMQVMN
jgi:AraC-like DNA-binding protein